jgi:hypothetical protein
VTKKATKRVKAKKAKPIKAKKARRAKVQRRATKKTLKTMVARDGFSSPESSLEVTPPVETPVIDIL